MSFEFNPSYIKWLIELRRSLHRIPEPAFTETKTAAVICKTLDEMKIPYTSKVAKTGIIAGLSAKKPGPVIAYRADMDALPLNELADVSFCSTHPGFMHACGHDAHVTIALGIIRWLIDSGWTENGSGEILFFFQPAEENIGGAKIMLETDQVDLEPIEAVFAVHMNPRYPAGQIEIRPGISCATTRDICFEITGPGGHGASPHLTRDPILAGAALIGQLQTIVSRGIDPLDSVVVTIGEFHAGSAPNIIPGKAMLNGTLRALSADVAQKALDRMKDLADGVAKSFGVDISFSKKEGYPALINDTSLCDFIVPIAERLLGENAVQLGRPTMGGEDFAYFANRWPSVMIGIGCHDPEKGFEYGLHSPFFMLDENALTVGVHLMSDLMVRYMNK